MNGSEKRTQGLSLDTVMKFGQLLLVAALPAIGWIANEVIDHGNRLSRIEASRFTASDGAELWKALSQPPQWFKETIERRLDKIDARLDKLVDEKHDGK